MRGSPRGVGMMILPYVLLVLPLNGASSRLAQPSLQRRQQQQQQQPQQQQRQQQLQELDHRKLVKLFGEDGTTNSADRIDGNYIVVLHENENLDSFLDSLKQQAQQQQIQIQHEYRHAMVGFAAEVYSQQTLYALLEDARVKQVAEDGHVYAETEPIVTTQTPAPENLDRIDQATGTDTSFQSRYTGKDNVVYIVDTGIRKTHEDFIKDNVGNVTTSSSRVRDECFTAFEGVGCHDDPLGHGTHVASTVGGNRWGIAKQVELVSVRVFDTAGIATWASFTAGIDYCIAQQKNSTKNIIVNMSMGGPVNPTFDAAVAVLVGEGAIVVAAAGNQNSFSCSRSPPNANGVIGVGNSALTDTRDLTSNYGACVDIWAPGVNVKAASSVCDSGDYCWKTLTGTSMASALVSGAYALYLEAERERAQAANATRQEIALEIKQKLLADATAIPALGVLGSAAKLLCIATLNNVTTGTSVPAAAAVSATAAATPPVAAKALNDTNATNTGMNIDAIGADAVLQMPVEPGEVGNGPGGKKEEKEEVKEKAAATNKPAGKGNNAFNKNADKKEEDKAVVVVDVDEPKNNNKGAASPADKKPDDKTGAAAAEGDKKPPVEGKKNASDK